MNFLFIPQVHQLAVAYHFPFLLSVAPPLLLLTGGHVDVCGGEPGNHIAIEEQGFNWSSVEEYSISTQYSY